MDQVVGQALATFRRINETVPVATATAKKVVAERSYSPEVAM